MSMLRVAEQAWANTLHRKCGSAEAKVCPWCGTLPFIQGWHGGTATKVLVGCESARCDLSPCVTGETAAEALRRWNKRAP
jgi:hypothetical protein